MKIILKLGNDVSTDEIYPGRFMATVLPCETPQYAFADLKEFNANLNGGVFPGEKIILGGENFGCGSSREQAASCLVGADIVVVAKSFARIFLQNAVNLGLQTIEVPNIEAEEGDELQIVDGKVVNKVTRTVFDIVPLSKTRQDIVNAGGLIPYTRARLTQG